MRLVLMLLLLLFNTAILKAIEPIPYKSTAKPLLIGKYIEYYEDAKSDKKIDDIIVLAKDGTNKFVAHHDDIANFKLTYSSFWIHFAVHNMDSANDVFLEVAQPLSDEVELFSIYKNGSREVRMLGDLKPFWQRDFGFPSFIVKLPIPSNEIAEFYIRVKNHEQQQLPIYLGNFHDIQSKNSVAETLIAIYIGVFMVMFFYNLFLFFSIRDKAYGYYVFYIITIGITQISLLGYGFKFIWPNSIWLQNHATYIFSGLSGVALSLFVMEFLGTRKVVPRLHKALQVVLIGYALCIPIACLFKLYIIGYNMLQVLGGGGALIVILIAILSLKRKVASARYFLIAWISFLIGLIFFIAKDIGIIPYNTYSLYTLPAGSAVELVLISFALANRINILKKEKEESQLKALRAAEENERLVTEQNIVLESEVKERTKDLQQALQELKRSEAELVNREKMSSLGLLTAGIAHEINNPINFVSASVTPLKRDISDIMSLLDDYSSLKNDVGISSKRFDEIEQKRTAMDTPFLIEEISMLLEGIEDGAVRTANIVRGLQKFSRSDEHFMKNSDLIDGIENTLILLNTQIKDQITVVREFLPIPFLDCSPGKLNQVFLNILSNAVYAVEHNNKKEKIITISTQLKDNIIYIGIKDNGPGIPKDALEKIFDPFYTTKEIGKGTGLGLSISYGIIKDHNGEILVESNLGEGAEFILKLPIPK